MKFTAKKLSVLLVVALLLGCLFTVFALAAPASSDYVLKATGGTKAEIGGFVLNGLDNGATEEDKKAADFSTVNYLDGNDYILLKKVGGMKEGEAAKLYLTNNIGNLITAVSTVSFDVSVGEKTFSEFTLNVYLGKGIPKAGHIADFKLVTEEGDHKGEVAIYAAGSATPAGYIKAYNWAHIDALYTPANRTFDLYVDGKQVVTGAPITFNSDADKTAVGTRTNYNYFSIDLADMTGADTYAAAAKDANIALDNLLVYKTGEVMKAIVPSPTNYDIKTMTTLFDITFEKYVAEEDADFKAILLERLNGMIATNNKNGKDKLTEQQLALFNMQADIDAMLLKYDALVADPTGDKRKTLVEEAQALLAKIDDNWVNPKNNNTKAFYAQFFADILAGYYRDLHNTNIAKLNDYLSKYNALTLNPDATDYNIALFGKNIAYKHVHAQISYEYYDVTADDYKDALARAEVAETEIKALIKDYNDKREARIDPAEYDSSVMVSMDFDSSTKAPGVSNGPTPGSYGIKSNDLSDNKYWEYRVPEYTNAFARIDNLVASNNQSTVFSFNFTSFAHPLRNANFYASLTMYDENWNNTETAGGELQWFSLTYNAENGGFGFSVENKVISGPKSLAEVAVINEWTNACFVYNPTEYTYDIYFDNIYIGTYSCKKTFNYYVDHLWFYHGFEATYADNASIAYDDFSIYRGTAPRTLNKFSIMTELEKFTYFNAAMQNTSYGVASRMTAWGRSKIVYDKYYDAKEGKYLTTDPAMIRLIDEFKAFDYESLYTAYCNENFATLVDYLKNFVKIERSLDTVKDREKLLGVISDFYNNNSFPTFQQATLPGYNGDLTADSNGQYNVGEVIREATLMLSNDKLAQTFYSYVQKANATNVLSAKKKWLNTAKANLAALDKSIAEVQSYIEAYNKALEAYDALYNNVNSRAFAIYMNKIGMYTTPAEYEENYADVLRFVMAARAIIYSGDYNEGYNGFAGAKETYDRINTYVYNKQMDEHVAKLTEMINNFRTASSFAAQSRSCDAADTYLANNDINREDPRIITLVDTLTKNKAVLKTAEESFLSNTEENATYFIHLVELMDTMTSFPELYDAYLRADEYFYMLDSTVEGAAEAIVKYNAYKEAILTIRANSEAFLAATEALGSNPSYEDLVVVYTLSLRAEYTYTGVAEALDSLNAKITAYNNDAQAVNTEVSATVTSVTKCIPKTSMKRAVLLAKSKFD